VTVMARGCLRSTAWVVLRPLQWVVLTTFIVRTIRII
jgi:hypothetical protein